MPGASKVLIHDFDQDGDLGIILGSFIYTPAPPDLQEKWRKEGPGVVVLQNQKVKMVKKVADSGKK